MANFSILGQTINSITGFVLEDTGGTSHTFYEPTLTTKSVTANGTYTATSDSADGYSSVTVNVPSASEASNVVVGSFTAGTAETVQTINVPYTGNGYIVSLTISVDGGIRGEYFYQIDHQYACAIFCGVKYYTSQAPDYTANNVNINGMTMLVTYKSSGNTTVSSGGSGSTGSTVAYTSNDPSASGASSIVRIASKNSVKIFVSASTSGQGFLSGAVYNYVAVYSE